MAISSRLTVLLILLVGGATLVHLPGLIADSRLRFAALDAASRCSGSGPLFLRAPCVGSGSPAIAPVCDMNRPDLCYDAALAALASGRVDVVQPLRTAVSASYRRPFSDALLTYALERRGEHQAAREIWEMCRTSGCESLLVRARTIESCSSVISLGNASPIASLCMGGVLRGANRLDEAMASYQSALAGASDVPSGDLPMINGRGPFSRSDVLSSMAEIELARGHRPEAEALLAECLMAEPGHYWGRFFHATILQQSGHPAEARDELLQLVSQHPDHGAAMLLLASLYESSGDEVEAVVWLRRAREVLPDKSLADVPLERLRQRPPR